MLYQSLLQYPNAKKLLQAAAPMICLIADRNDMRRRLKEAVPDLPEDVRNDIVVCFDSAYACTQLWQPVYYHIRYNYHVSVACAMWGAEVIDVEMILDALTPAHREKILTAPIHRYHPLGRTEQERAQVLEIQQAAEQTAHSVARGDRSAKVKAKSGTKSLTGFKYLTEVDPVYTVASIAATFIQAGWLLFLRQQFLVVEHEHLLYKVIQKIKHAACNLYAYLQAKRRARKVSIGSLWLTESSEHSDREWKTVLVPLIDDGFVLPIPSDDRPDLNMHTQQISLLLQQIGSEDPRMAEFFQFVLQGGDETMRTNATHHALWKAGLKKYNLSKDDLRKAAQRWGGYDLIR